MSPRIRDTKHHAKAQQRRRRTAQERLARDRRQAQHAAEALQHALDDLGLPEDLITGSRTRWLRIMFWDFSPAGCCQMDTSFRLGWSGAHNTIHSRKITEMLQATPQCFGPWLVTAAAPHKAAKLRDPAHGLAQCGWLCRRRGTVMDGTIQRLPFLD